MRPSPKKALAWLFAAAAIALLAPAPAAAASASQELVTVPSKRALYGDGHGGRYLLDGPWYFRLDPQDQGRFLGLPFQESLDGWTQVSVPNAWNAQDLSEESQRGTVGWYRKDFRVPPATRTTTWRLRFESVNYLATVYLNGRVIGTHVTGYIPFEVPASSISKTGVNRLVIRVDNRRKDTSLPPLRDQALTGLPGGGWWNYGGLLREVYLRKVDRVDIDGLLARPSLPCRRCAATVLLRATLHNPGGGTKRVAVRGSVGGKRAKFPDVTVPSGGSRVVFATVTLRRPRLWEPGKGRLYPVSAAVVLGKRRRVLSTYSTHVGIRSFKVDARGRLYINGRRFALRGASVHEDHPVQGAALSPDKRAQMFGQLLELGANLTRAHYPLHPQFLEMADRAGVLVWDQIPFYRIPQEFLRLKSVRNRGLNYLGDTIRRDQNHASVLAWSIANELASRPRRGQKRYMNAAVNLAKRLDPTRLTAIDFAGYPSVRLIQIYRRFDALGMNSYAGWYPGPTGQIHNREVLGQYLNQLHEYYPRQALFVTEFGAEANRPGPAWERGSYEFQRDFMRFHFQTYAQKRFVNGAIAWLLRDFKVRPGWDGGNPYPTPPYNRKGLVDEYGRKKPAFGDTAALISSAKAGRR